MRFTIRDLFWLTALAAVGLAWWVDRQYLISQLRPWGVVVSPPSREAADRAIEAEVERRIAALKRKGLWNSPPDPSARLDKSANE